MDNAVYLTKEGYKELEQRLQRLKSVGRVEVANKIEFARSFGDIKENSEYDAAREEEAMLEQEISKLENSLRNAKLISKNKTECVAVGSTVVVTDVSTKKVLTFKIMGSLESDPLTGKISNVSPIGKALINAKIGDVVTITTPARTTKFKIKEIL